MQEISLFPRLENNLANKSKYFQIVLLATQTYLGFLLVQHYVLSTAPGIMYFVFCRLLPLLPSAITGMFGSYLSSLYS
jgi:hypothetical protein